MDGNELSFDYNLLFTEDAIIDSLEAVAAFYESALEEMTIIGESVIQESADPIESVAKFTETVLTKVHANKLYKYLVSKMSKDEKKKKDNKIVQFCSKIYNKVKGMVKNSPVGKAYNKAKGAYEKTGMHDFLSTANKAQKKHDDTIRKANDSIKKSTDAADKQWDKEKIDNMNKHPYSFSVVIGAIVSLALIMVFGSHLVAAGCAAIGYSIGGTVLNIVATGLGVGIYKGVMKVEQNEKKSGKKNEDVEYSDEESAMLSELAEIDLL